MFLTKQMNKVKDFNRNKIIERLESELLSALFDYIVPFLDKKIDFKTKQEKEPQTKNLEHIVGNSKPKVEFKDVKELETLLLKNLSESVKINKSIGINSSDVFYSLNLRLQENKLKISIKKDEKEIYSSEITNKKDAKDKVVPYSIRISYEDGYAEERLSITYRQQLKNYLHKHLEDKEDMTNRVPLKWLNILPESMMGGVLGFTYLGDNSMGRRADLVGKTARMVDIHESIHTPDEYETRVLTSWIMEKVRGKYIK